MIAISVEKLRTMVKDDTAVLDHLVELEKANKPIVQRAGSLVGRAVKKVRRSLANAIDIRETQ